MNRFGMATLAGVALICAGSISAVAGVSKARKFELSTKSEEAKNLLSDLQNRIENFEAGPALAEQARNIITADPEFAMGEYYLSAVVPPNEGQPHLDKAIELSKKASEGERRFIEAMTLVRADGGANFRDALQPFEKLAADYPDERVVFMLLGQLYQATGDTEKARGAFEHALEIGPLSPRAKTFIANFDLLDGQYGDARTTLGAVMKDLPSDSAPFAVYYGIAFSHLYEENSDKAIASLKIYLDKYRASGGAQAFPEVFILNSIARIQLEAGQAAEAMQTYEKGYESVESSTISEDQKQVWLGRLLHGKCRSLAKMGKHDEAGAVSAKIHEMIDSGGEAAEQYLPAYHYLVGYLKIESGDLDAALEHLKKANANDPFHNLLLARTYEKKGDKENARKAFTEIVSSTNNGLERALAYTEAKRQLSIL